MQVVLSSVSKSYGSGPARVSALRSVSIDVGDGDFLCLWGPSGSGKSTLLNLLGLLDSLDEGRYRFDDRDVSKLSQRERSEFRNKHMGFVFQSFNLIPVLSAVENVMFPLQVRGVSDTKARKAALTYLDRVGLSEEAHRLPEQLSGGQRQRVAIARALVGEPSLVLADEPTANLDSETSTQILELMRALNRDSATTFVLATHDLEVKPYASRHIYLRDGRLQDAPQAAAGPGSTSGFRAAQ